MAEIFSAELPPDYIDDLLIDLEDADDGRDVIKRITPNDCGWLARALREKIWSDEERMPDDIERELDVS